MLDEDDRHAHVGDLENEIQGVGELARVEPGMHFVEEKKVRLHGEALGQLQAFAVGEREVRGGIVGKAVESHELQVVLSENLIRPGFAS